jgi:hypothetical protein
MRSTSVSMMPIHARMRSQEVEVEKLQQKIRRLEEKYKTPTKKIDKSSYFSSTEKSAKLSNKKKKNKIMKRFISLILPKTI